MNKNYTLILPGNYVPPPLYKRDEWIKALRSGEYRQGCGVLAKRNRKAGISYCCLGVYEGPVCGFSIDLTKPPRWLLEPVLRGLTCLDEIGFSPDGVLIVFEDNYPSPFSLEELNDERKLSFTEIADIIEQVWSHTDIPYNQQRLTHCF